MLGRFVLLAVVSAVFAPVSVAHAAPNAPIHGPDYSLPLNLNSCFRITVQPGEVLRVDFFSSADYENEAILYDTSGLTAVRRGNYLNMKSWSWRNDTGRVHQFIVSGWHKNGRPSGRLRWHQSPIRVFQGGPAGAVGFEDSNDNSYNDMVVRYRLTR